MEDENLSNLIMDRTQEDVDRVTYLATQIFAGTATADEVTEFLSPALKGAYNYTDLNRVGWTVNYLSLRLYDVAGIVAEVTGRQDWTETDIPTLGDMQTYLADIATIRAALDVPETVPAVPSDMVWLNYIEANNIEQILYDVNELILQIIASWRYAGELYAGEV